MAHNARPTQPRAFESLGRSDESFNIVEIDQSYSGCSWHFHPELQLCFVERGEGTRVIGDRLCPIETGEVVLLGPNLPHVWRYHAEQARSIRAIVVHFDESLLGTQFLHKPELRDIRLLLARAEQGLQAHGATRAVVAEQMTNLCGRSGFARILGLLEILHRLAESRELTTISSTGFQPIAAQLDVERLRCACDYIRKNAHGAVDRDTVAHVVHMSPSGFSRFFKTHTGMTFQDFLADVRVSLACELLVDSRLSVTEIAYACGFSDLSTFNRAFKKFRDLTPTQYRHRILEVTNPNLERPLRCSDAETAEEM